MNYRYERKFVVKGLMKQQVDSIIKHLPTCFSEIYHKRTVNNIYLDTTDISFVSDNVIGIPNRKKVRIRWYGSTFGHIEAPVLEIKQKFGLLGRKEKYPIVAFSLDTRFSQKTVDETINKSRLPDYIDYSLKSLKISLLNSYIRKYYMSSDHKFRITVDNDLRFYRIKSLHNLFVDKIVDNFTFIIELKYDQANDNGA